jgi:hydroxymethylglutaryl-CoA reductase
MVEEVVIIDARRTPIGKYHGLLKKFSAVALGTAVAKDILKRNSAMKDEIAQVIIGNVLQAGNGQNPARQVAIQSGLSVEVPATTINEVCGSGLKAILMGMEQIQLGKAQVVLTGGIESMTNAPSLSHYNKAEDVYSVPVSSMTVDGLTDAFSSKPMGLTAENVSQRYGVSREAQDQFAYRSQMKAAKAQSENKFAKEIVPLVNETGTITQDEGIRSNTTLEKLATLKPVFKADGTVTAGNASTINDGAALVLLASKSYCEAKGIPYLAVIKEVVEVGIEPEIMGISPIKAIRKLVENQNISLTDVGIFEINEAFAASSIVVEAELGLDATKVNPLGGGISLGHPIGATGARLVTSLVYQMQEMQERYGIASLCIGGGLGLAVLLERPTKKDTTVPSKKFYQLSPAERLQQLENQQTISSATKAELTKMTLASDTANHLIENQISEVELPMGVGMNLVVDGKSYLVPMATEEPSVIAAMSNGAKMAGEVKTESHERLLRGQIVFSTKKAVEIEAQINAKQSAIFERAAQSYPSIVKREGGLRRIALRHFPEDSITQETSVNALDFLSVDLFVDVKDAMGANIMNAILEGVAELFRSWFPEEEILFSILSNLATESLVTAVCEVPFAALSKSDGHGVAQKIAQASIFAQIDPYRAVTHNKGIMNGVEAFMLATGNDTRAVSAACHGYAARNGHYQGLTNWKVTDNGLVGEITLPLAIATVGGATKVLPKAQGALEISQVTSAKELAAVAASVGLVQNLAALRALVSEGIQKGHMSMQARALAIAVGAEKEEIEEVAEKLRQNKLMNQQQASKFLAEIRQK